MSKQILEELGIRNSPNLVETNGHLHQRWAGARTDSGEVLGEVAETRVLLVHRRLRPEQYKAVFAAGYEVETLASLMSRKMYSEK